MKHILKPAGLAGFGLTSTFSVAHQWSLQEFCWSAWLTGLVFSWACVVVAVTQILLNARGEGGRLGERIPRVRNLPPVVLWLAVSLAGLGIGWVALQLYCRLFGFYGLFLSVFAEMEPAVLFGRNGFINSDFFSPVAYLISDYWPMALGNLVASGAVLLRGDPWKRVFLPFQSEVVHIHLMVLALPFLTMLAWALFRDAYQPVTVVLLTALFFLAPKGRKKEAGALPETQSPA